MRLKYEKPPLSYEQQADKLLSRGLIIGNKQFVINALSSINYYRLSAYFLPFQKDKENHIYYPGKKIEDIIQLYQFDCEYRHLLFKIVESAEVLAKTRLTYHLVMKYNDPFCYLNKKLYSNRFLGGQIIVEDLVRQCRHFPDIDVKLIWKELKNKSYISNDGLVKVRFQSIDDFKLCDVRDEVKEAIFISFSISPFEEWLGKMRDSVLESKEEFIRHFRKKYTGSLDLPLWMVTETISFGQLSKLYAGLNKEDRQRIAEIYGLTHRLLGQWLHSLVYLRNICAHHARLWNRDIEIKPIKPKHLDDKNVWTNKVFSILLVLKRMVENTSEWETFVEDLKALLERNQFVNIRDMGFPADWERWLEK